MDDSSGGGEEEEASLSPQQHLAVMERALAANRELQARLRLLLSGVSAALDANWQQQLAVDYSQVQGRLAARAAAATQQAGAPAAAPGVEEDAAGLLGAGLQAAEGGSWEGEEQPEGDDDLLLFGEDIEQELDWYIPSIGASKQAAEEQEGPLEVGTAPPAAIAAPPAAAAQQPHGVWAADPMDDDYDMDTTEAAEQEAAVAAAVPVATPVTPTTPLSLVPAVPALTFHSRAPPGSNYSALGAPAAAGPVAAAVPPVGAAVDLLESFFWSTTELVLPPAPGAEGVAQALPYLGRLWKGKLGAWVGKEVEAFERAVKDKAGGMIFLRGLEVSPQRQRTCVFRNMLVVQAQVQSTAAGAWRPR
jgi:hypothetical protein